jgi:chromosome segregation ATPase
MAKKDATPEATDPKVEDPKEDKTKDPVQPVEPNYEDRFKGLQRTFDRQQKKYTALEEQYESLLEQTETSKQAERERQAELDALKKEQDDAKAELDKLTGELATQETKGQRASMIMSQFPDLAPFEADGLLPEAETEEEMVDKFTAFREALEKRVKSTVEQQIVGTAPGDTGTIQTVPVRDANALYARLTQLAGKRDAKSREEYDRLMGEWDEIQKEKL